MRNLLSTMRLHQLKKFSQHILRCIDSRPLTYSYVRQHTASRSYSNQSSQKYELFPLNSRGVLQLSGVDAVNFLQGIVTNDVTVLGENCKALHSLLLNVQGRVLYDLIMYHQHTESGESSLLLECDQTVREELIKLMKKYKIRKKVNISDVTEERKVFAVAPADGASSDTDAYPGNTASLVTATADPRLNKFGWRVIATEMQPIIDGLENQALVRTEEDYHIRRYKWGLGEGLEDMPPGNCFPLESNAVFLNGVCFHKGCYIGQELTARTHHTGVTRKRLMPLVFDKDPGNLVAGSNINTESGKSAGKFRAAVGRYGLGLLRLNDINKKLSVTNEAGESIQVTAERPEWWELAESQTVDRAEK